MLVTWQVTVFLDYLCQMNRKQNPAFIHMCTCLNDEVNPVIMAENDAKHISTICVSQSLASHLPVLLGLLNGKMHIQHTHMQAWTHTHTHTHACMKSHTHTHTHTHTYWNYMASHWNLKSYNSQVIKSNFKVHVHLHVHNLLSSYSYHPIFLLLHGCILL